MFIPLHSNNCFRPLKAQTEETEADGLQRPKTRATQPKLPLASCIRTFFSALVKGFLVAAGFFIQNKSPCGLSPAVCAFTDHLQMFIPLHSKHLLSVCEGTDRGDRGIRAATAKNTCNSTKTTSCRPFICTFFSALLGVFLMAAGIQRFNLLNDSAFRKLFLILQRSANTMAKPIKETPVLKGKDAVAFIKNMQASEGKTVDKKTRERIKSNFSKLQSIAKF